jgi:hypothetical protein
VADSVKSTLPPGLTIADIAGLSHLRIFRNLPSDDAFHAFHAFHGFHAFQKVCVVKH